MEIQQSRKRLLFICLNFMIIGLYVLGRLHYTQLESSFFYIGVGVIGNLLVLYLNNCLLEDVDSFE